MGCFEMVGRPVTWRGQGISEEGVDEKSGEVLVQVSSKYFRPTEVETLLGDCTKAKTELKWTPKTSFKALILDMLEDDCERIGIEIPAGASKIVERQDEY